MRRGLVLLVAVLSFAGQALAAEFVVVGPRALGMGGAQVAVVDDATAVYWNPAAIADYEGWKFSFPLGIQAVEQNDIIDTLSDVDDVLGDLDLDSPAIYFNLSKISELVELFEKLDKPGTGITVSADVGLVTSNNNIAFGMIDLAYLGGWVTMDLENVNIGPPVVPNSIANNETSVSVLGLESQELSVSYAREINQILVGGNAKYISGTTYYKSVNVGEDTDIEGDLEEESSSSLGVDMGLLYNFPNEKWRAGLVVRNINSPSFSYQYGDVELEPQARAGVAYQVSENVVVACDIDVTENESITPGYDDRKLALGIESKKLGGKVALRSGIYKNIAESSADPVITTGLGIGRTNFKFDLGFGASLGFEELALSLGFSTVF